jgi:signal transduction histidine kinase
VSLRTKYLIAVLLVSAGLTTGSLIAARRVITRQIHQQIMQDLRNSVATFENVQHEREADLTRSARLIADLPIVRALMTTEHAATIQDGSKEIWRSSGASVLVFANPNGKVLALQSESLHNDDCVQNAFARSLTDPSSTHWWFCGGHLLEIATQPIYVGAAAQAHVVGSLAVGSEIDDQVARQLSQVAGSQVVFGVGNNLLRSTLSPAKQDRLSQLQFAPSSLTQVRGQEVQIDDERFLGTEVHLGDAPEPVRLVVLKSLDQSSAFLKHLDRLLFQLGLLALLAGAFIVAFVSKSITRPLEKLVAGVRALATGDFEYPLQTSGKDEVAELTTAFDRMRSELQQGQRELLEAERLATIGRMASSISHDLRHHLSAVVANAEFLSDNRRKARERDELYSEIRFAVHQMTDLIESLLEFSRTRASLNLEYGAPEDAIRTAIQSVHMRPEFRDINIQFDGENTTEGNYDLKKLERVFQNLLINSCEALPTTSGSIHINARETESQLEIRVRDTGRGVPDSIKSRIFDPFITQGKANGTGLGLTIAHKILQDHGGDLRLESSSLGSTVFLVVLPISRPVEPKPESGPPLPAAVAH